MNRQEHLLTILMEECSEFSIELSELILLDNDLREYNGSANHDLMLKEFNDIMAIINMLNEEGIDIFRNNEFIRIKRGEVKKHLKESDTRNDFEKLLIILIKECNELSIIASKSQRFGIDSNYQGLTNHEMLQLKFNGILALVDMLSDEGLFLYSVPDLIVDKLKKVEKFLQFSKNCNTLQ